MSRDRVDIEGSARPAVFGAVSRGDVSPDEIVTAVLLLRTPRGAPPLVETARDVVRTREPWSHERYAATYGASPDDLARIEAFAREWDLSVVEVHRPSRAVTLRGTARAFMAAFGVKLDADWPAERLCCVHNITASARAAQPVSERCLSRLRPDRRRQRRGVADRR